LSVGKILIKKQTQVLLEEIRGVGLEMALKIHEKTKFRQQTFLAICTRIMPYWARKLQNYRFTKKYIRGKHEKLLLSGKTSSRDLLTSVSRQDVNQD